MATRHAGVGTTILDKHAGPASTKQPTTTTTLPPPVPGAPVTVTPGTPAPGTPAQISIGEGPVKPGQPSVTLSDPRTGEQKTLPLNIPAPPAGTPPQQQPPPKK